MSVGRLNDDDYAGGSEVWRQSLELYHTVKPEEQSKNTWSRIMDPDGDLHAFVVRDEQGKIIGLSHYLFHCSSWSDKPVCYLNGKYPGAHPRVHNPDRRCIPLLTLSRLVRRQIGPGQRHREETDHGNAPSRKGQGLREAVLGNSRIECDGKEAV